MKKLKDLTLEEIDHEIEELAVRKFEIEQIEKELFVQKAKLNKPKCEGCVNCSCSTRKEIAI